MKAKQEFKTAFGAVRAKRSAADALMKKTNVSYDGETDISAEDALLQTGVPAGKMLGAAIYIAMGQRDDVLLKTLAERNYIYPY